MAPRVRVQREDFRLADELDGFGRDGTTGATVSFTGIVRDDTGDLIHLDIEHYPGMCEAAISEIVAQAEGRWDLTDVRVIHRFGQIAVGEQIMMVATAARHRVEAFEAAEFLMDYLKSRAPFWKKEVTKSGSDWVAAKDADEDALKRW